MSDKLSTLMCPMCNGDKDTPRLMSDDSYAQFLCPHPFHRGLSPGIPKA